LRRSILVVVGHAIRYASAVQCPDERAVAGIDGDAAAVRALFGDHIDECNPCRRVVAELVRSSTDAASDWRPGRRVGRYVLGERIGRGGMGAVYRATDVELGREIALKRLHAGARGDGRARLVAEARSAAQLQHPNVVAVYEVVDAEGVPFLAMELVDGVTLTTWLRGRSRTWREIVAVLVQAGRGLAAAHARGLVHRDFKPENILVDREGRARVADFGLANSDARGAPEQLACRPAWLTATRSGTPAYMAPELVTGAAPGVRSDIYAFAVTLFEALHGAHPFAGTTVETLWAEMALGRIRSGDRRIPRWLERHVRRGLALDPDDRWPDVAAFVDAIDRGSRRRYTVAAAGAAGFAVAGVVAWMVMPSASHANTCEAGASLVDDVWNDTSRRAVADGFTSGARDRANPALAAASQIVDQWARAWRHARSAACTAPVEHRAARVGCLDRQLHELREQIALWSRADATVVDRAAQAAGQLPSPIACSAAVELPPWTQSVSLQLAQAKVQWRSGHMTDAKKTVTVALREAEAFGHHGLLAQALLAASIVAQDSEVAAAEGRAHADRAVSEASKAGDNALLYVALVNQARTRAVEGRPHEALGLCDAAEALAARGVPEPQQVAQMRGTLLDDIGRSPEAVKELRRAIDLVEPRAKAGQTYARLQLATMQVDLGTALLHDRDVEAALDQYTQARVVFEAILGPTHPTVARAIESVATAEMFLGRLDESRRHFEAARALHVAAAGEAHPSVAAIDVQLARLVEETAPDEALRMLERARARLTGVRPANDEIFAIIEFRLGSIEFDREREAAALPHFERAAEIMRSRQAGDTLVTVYTTMSECQFNLGKLADATRLAEQALVMVDETKGPDAKRLQAWAMLAVIAEARRDWPRAITYAGKVIAATSDETVGHAASLRKLMRDRLTTWERKARRRRT
jgi:tetratricopeptide (TPR) repeat protein